MTIARRWLAARHARATARTIGPGAPPAERSDVAQVVELLRLRQYETALDLLASPGIRLARPEVAALSGVALAGLGRQQESIDALRRGVDAIVTGSSLRDVCMDALDALGSGADIEQIARDISTRAPADARAALIVGRCCLARSAPQEAETSLRHVVRLDPGHARAWSALGLALRRQDRDAEALDAYEAAERATASGGEDVDAFADVAYMLQRTGRFEEARELLEAELAMRPSVAAHRGYAEVLLTLGDFAAGFTHYEFRWMPEPLAASRLGPVRPPWSGQPLAGKTILLRVEQGYGDTFQFLRYVELVKRLGATILMRRFCDLVDEMPQVDVVLRDGDPVTAFDYYANLGSLPRIFGTTLATIPADVPYLDVPAAKRGAWRERLAECEGLKVGIVWSGNALPDPRRSITLSALRPLLEVPGVTFFGLQKGVPDSEVLATSAGRVQPLGALLLDFGDTAAAIAAVDLVISIDTAVAHLAGALGKPVWTMLVANADWRWMADREDSPWYPTMRLFRQQRRGDWGPVIARVADALARAVEHRGELGAGRRDDEAATPVPRALGPYGAGARRFSQVTETRYGIVQHANDSSDESLGLQRYGEHLQAQLQLLERFVGPGAAVLEVAPGAGAHTLALASLVGPTGRLALVEGRSFERRMLIQNLRSNRVTEGVVVLERLPGAAEASRDALDLTRLDLIKVNASVDAVGAVAACEALIWQFRPVVIVTLPEAAGLRPLVDLLRRLGYCAWRREAPLYNPDNFFCRPEDEFAGRRSLGVVAGPEESARPLLDDQPML